MKTPMQARLWLLLPTLFLYAADVSLTLGGQPGDYWVGNYNAAVEFNPLARPLLVVHPACFVVLAIAWGGAMVIAALYCRHQLVVWLIMFLALGHAIGGSSWLTQHGLIGWVAAIAYLAAAAEFSHWCWRRALVSKE